MLEFAIMHIVFFLFFFFFLTKIMKNMYNMDTHVMQVCDHFKINWSEHCPDNSNDTSFLFYYVDL